MSVFSCPHCHKTVKDLKLHLQRMHPDKLVDNPENNPENADLVIEVNQPADTKFHCVDCGHAVEKGQTNCPNPDCNVKLDWEGVKNGES